jgi:hypothetical protein
MIKTEYLDRSFAINLNEEVSCVVKFIRATWENTELLEGLDNFVKDIFAEGIKDGRNWVDYFSDRNLDEERAVHLEKINMEDFDYLDSSYRFLIESFNFTSKIKNQALKDFDFTTNTAKLVKLMKEKYTIPRNLQPIGWNSFKKGYVEYDGMAEFDHNKNDDLFLGHNSTGAGSYPFHARISLPQVMYDEQEQGRNRLYTLVGSIYAHALFCIEQNNSHGFAKDYNELAEKLIISDFSFKKFSLESTNRFLVAAYKNTAMDTAIDQADFDRQCDGIREHKAKKKAEWDSKSKVEQEAILLEKQKTWIDRINQKSDD